MTTSPKTITVLLQVHVDTDYLDDVQAALDIATALLPTGATVVIRVMPGVVEMHTLDRHGKMTRCEPVPARLGTLAKD